MLSGIFKRQKLAVSVPRVIVEVLPLTVVTNPVDDPVPVALSPTSFPNETSAKSPLKTALAIAIKSPKKANRS